MNVPKRCPHCHAPAPKIPSRWLRVAALSGAWFLSLIYMFGVGVLGPLGIPLLPIIVLAGMAIITEAHRWASADIACARCRKFIVIDGELQTVAASAPTWAHDSDHGPTHSIAA